MRLTVRRVGGMLPSLRLHATHDLDTLDEATRQAVLAFVKTAPRASRAAHVEAMSYVFELGSGKTMQVTSAVFAAVPEPLRALLPTPKTK
jgi:hypothetical protein